MLRRLDGSLSFCARNPGGYCCVRELNNWRSLLVPYRMTTGIVIILGLYSTKRSRLVGKISRWKLSQMRGCAKHSYGFWLCFALDRFQRHYTSERKFLKFSVRSRVAELADGGRTKRFV